MKDFDLEAAKAGKPVMCKIGHAARVLCFDFKNKEYPLVVAVARGNSDEEELHKFALDGSYCNGTRPTDFDLRMAPEKKYGAMWIDPNTGLTDCTQELYNAVAELEAQLAKWGSHAVEFACQSNDEINEARGGTDE